jgi:hypothetical protein
MTAAKQKAQQSTAMDNCLPWVVWDVGVNLPAEEQQYLM